MLRLIKNKAHKNPCPVDKIAEKADCSSLFLTLYFECQINNKSTPSDCFSWRFCLLDGNYESVMKTTMHHHES